MQRLLERRDAWGRPAAVWVVAGAAFLLPLIGYALSQIHLQNDVEHWLPADDPEARTFAWYREHFGAEEKVLLSWPGSAPEDSRFVRLAAAVRGQLDTQGVRRGGSQYFATVRTPQEAIDAITERGVPADVARQRLVGLLLGAGPLRVTLAPVGRGRDAIDLAEVRTRLAQAVQQTIGVRPEVTDVQDMLDVQSVAGGSAGIGPTDAPPTATPVIAARQFDLFWTGMRGDATRLRRVRQALLAVRDNRGYPIIAAAETAPGTPAAAVLTLTEAGVADYASALADLKERATQAGLSASELILGGSPVAAVTLNAAMKQSNWNPDAPWWNPIRRSPMLMSMVVSLLLALILLRNVRLTLFVLSATLLATLAAVAVVPATGAQMNMVLVVMPTLLMVLALSAAIHLAGYHRRAALAGAADPAVAAVNAAFWPCVLAAVTTALGLASLASSPLEPVRDFGIYAAIGCLIVLPAVLWFLPALLQLWPVMPRPERRVATRSWRRLALWLVRYRQGVLAVSLIAFLLGIGGLSRFHTETKAIRYFPADAPIVQDYHFLEDRLTGVVPVEALIVFDDAARKRLNFAERMERVRAVTAALRTNAEVTGAISLADFFPIDAPPKADATRFAKATYARRMAETQRRLIAEPGSAGAFFAIAKQAAPTRGGKPLADAGDELWRVTAHTTVLSDVDYAVTLPELDRLTRTAAGPYARQVITGAMPLFLRTQHAVLDSLIVSFAAAFVLIAAVMAVLLRSVTAGLIAMLPNLLPVVVVFGAISWGGLAVDIGTMITASVALGVAVDGTLHLCEAFRASASRPGVSRRRAVTESLVTCGPSLWQTSLVVGCGLSMLTAADLLLVNRFGWLMASLVGVALLGDVLLLPALLAGPLGRLLQRQTSRRRPTAATNPPHATVWRPRLVSTETDN